MFSVLVQNMIEQYDYPVLTEETLGEFLESSEGVVLFFTEDAKKFPETNDVAMILPELVGAFNGRFSAAVIAMPDQRKLQMHYGFREWPTLVFLRNGEYLGAISRVQDWNDYLEKISQILASEPTKAPDFMLPVSGSGAGCSA
jgi:hydrogenase-1 operon protein HyaE